MNNQLYVSINKELSKKLTENGAFAYSSSFDNTLDLFALIGALRERSEKDIINLFIKSYAENPLYALKCLFYARDIKEGLGERRTSRILLKHMANTHPEVMLKNLPLISMYGRFDDYYAFANTPIEKEAFLYLNKIFINDLENMKEGKPVSLLAKWLKSVNTGSYKSRELGRLTASYFNMNLASYRKSLSALRKYIDVTEVKMCANNWNTINYSSVPSYAFHNYSNAFKMHDTERFNAFMKEVSEGTKKLNANVLYPYDIVSSYTHSYYMPHTINQVLEEEWKALPNFVTSNMKSIVMCDVSESMDGLPMDVSTSLAIYFAERNNGYFHNAFLTFTNIPRLIKLEDRMTLLEKLILTRENIGYDTNLELAFDKVLAAAIEGQCSNDDMPDNIMVITDMEINQFGSGINNISFISYMKEKYEAAGYKLPKLIFWNVNARHNTFLATKDDNVIFVSGASATIFKSICERGNVSAIEYMKSVLDVERYALVTI